MRKSKKDESIATVIEKRYRRLQDRHNFRNLIRRVVMLIIIGYLLVTRVFIVAQIEGQGMFPALKDGDLAIGFRIQIQPLQKNDIVIYTFNGSKYFGRIAACGGDLVDISDNNYLVVNDLVQNGEIMYPTYAGDMIEFPYRVPNDSYFVLGDYRTQTQDSRDFDAIPVDAIEAKVITILRRRGL